MRRPDTSGRRYVLAHVLGFGVVLALAGCAATAPPATVPVSAPPQWYAPLPPGTTTPTSSVTPSLPHNGSLTGLSQWWQQQNDPLLVELIEAAQAVSPSVITARSNIEQAQATRASSEAALLPTLDGTGGLSRSQSAPINRTIVAPPTNLAQLGLQTSWELDMFGQNRASLEADKERLQGTEAMWHDARVSVAAEVANQYYSLRACEKLLLIARADARSRAETARLTGLMTRAGFEAPATAALARASSAEGNSRVTQQQAQCEVDVKALVALTAFAEPALRQKLEQAQADVPQQGIAEISSIPAEVLAQRPDVFNAARELTAASFEVGSARAQRYPRLSITGSVTTNRARARAFSQNFDTWSIGPLALTVPLFDGGVSQAHLEAAKTRYEEAAGKYRATVRQAVREVEEALVNLQSTTDRGGDTVVASEGYRASFAGTEARYKAGLASLVELEESRRTLLSAQGAVANLEKERRSAWIALYRALGGGWTVSAPPATPMVFDIPASALPSWP
ncbi:MULTISPECIES: efflux transporter outer membrane subunit [Polaromonas]|uniref:Efflux transporter outer membrane subunit n=1 Tax=Polaromonas aquatica TaxID=332657 RepID=A0ABW1TXA6_9BURK